MAGDDVRRRLTVLAALVTAGVLLVASLALVAVFWRSEVRHADSLDRARLAELSALVRADEVPPVLTDVGDDGFAQVVVADRVAGGSASLGGSGPVTGWSPGPDPEVRDLDGVPDDEETEDYRVWGVTLDGPGGPTAVYVGTAREVIQESVRSLALTLAGGVPALLALATALIWVLVGRTLRPVVAAQARQRDFVADAAHELQSPLASYRAQLEVALRDPGGTDWALTAGELLGESDRMERLVRDLLFLARQDDRAAAPGAMLDLDDVVLEEVARLGATGGPVVIDAAGVSAAPVLGRRDDLARLVRNLLANAVRHAEAAVSVSCAVHGSEVVLVVQDDGPGIPPAEREHVFERFVRADPARGHGQGAGLGLAIVRAVALRHGGTVRVAESDAGARLEVRLPGP